MSLTEKELAAAGVLHLQAIGYEVSHEVMLESALRGQTDIGMGRADIVARKGGLLGVLEVKLTLSWDLFSQTRRWAEYANTVTMLVPWARENDGRLFAFDVARRFGFGVWELHGDRGVVERIAPRVRDSIDPELAQSLRPEHQNGKYARAGQSGAANIYTPGNAMEAAFVAYVAKHPGCTIEEAVAGIKHVFRRNERAVDVLTKKLRREEIAGVYRGLRQRLYSTPQRVTQRVREPEGDRHG